MGIKICVPMRTNRKSRTIGAYTRWLYIMDLKETLLLVSKDEYFIDSLITKHVHIDWYKQEKEMNNV